MARDSADIPDAMLRMHLARGLGPATIRRLREHFGGDDEAARATPVDLAAVEGISRAQAEAIRGALDAADPAGERQAMAAAGARMIILGDEDYPPLLATIADPPAALWIRGSLCTRDRLAVAIVGSRRCSAYGREQAGRLAALLAQCGTTIVSGGAFGIDGEAHRGALRGGGRTIAVMGCGLAHCYPPHHGELFARIVQSGGALLSAFPMQVEPRPQHFPRRNRIIAGLSLGVVMVEAAAHSGALITAREASQEGREVMAVPGRLDSPASAGCLRAIREGWAALVTGHVDILQQLDAASHLVCGALERAGDSGPVRAESLFDAALSPGQQVIVDALRRAGRALRLEEVAAATGLPVAPLMAELTLLQVRGLVERDREGIRPRR